MIYMSIPKLRADNTTKCRIKLNNSYQVDTVRRIYRKLRSRGASPMEARLVIFDLLFVGQSSKFSSESYPAGV